MPVATAQVGTPLMLAKEESAKKKTKKAMTTTAVAAAVYGALCARWIILATSLFAP